MTRGVAETGSIETAALAIAIGVLANTALKTAVALVFGGARFRAIVAATLAVTMAAAAAAILALM